MIETQLDIGYESSSGFRDVFSKIMDASTSPSSEHQTILNASLFDTPLGAMLAIANDEALIFLDFASRKGLELKVNRLKKRMDVALIPGNSPAINSIEKEIQAYFSGSLKKFVTPIQMQGSPFQKMVWDALIQIPYGETRSYAEQAQIIGKATAYRAVANANGANPLSIIVPCHRIINSSGGLGGYGGGITRKKWLLDHEQKQVNI